MNKNLFLCSRIFDNESLINILKKLQLCQKLKAK